jgi:hypothetical protein
MTWRDIYADQNLRMAGVMLEQQGKVNALEAKIQAIRVIIEAHRDCPSHIGCDGLLEIQAVIDGD